jgi:hypothetical protein
MPATTSSACPNCRQPAPIRLEGLEAICTACHRKRSVFGGTSLDLAGKPQKVGGIAARVAGWLGLALGTFASVTVGGIVALLGQWLADYPTPGYVIGAVMWLCTVGLSLTAIVGGRKLSAAGKSAQQDKQRQAVYALARHRNGIVSAKDAAASLGLAVVEADAFLTKLARQPGENILVDIDDDGSLLYLFENGQVARETAKWQRIEQQANLRVAGDEGHHDDQQALAEEELRAADHLEKARPHLNK